MSQRLFDSIRKIIESGIYDRAELLAKIETLEAAGRLTAEEANALRGMM